MIFADLFHKKKIMIWEVFPFRAQILRAPYMSSALLMFSLEHPKNIARNGVSI